MRMQGSWNYDALIHIQADQQGLYIVSARFVFQVGYLFLKSKQPSIVPPPYFIKQGVKTSLPIIIQLPDQDSSLSPYITLNNIHL